MLIVEQRSWAENIHCYSQAYYEEIKNQKGTILQHVNFTFYFFFNLFNTSVYELSKPHISKVILMTLHCIQTGMILVGPKSFFLKKHNNFGEYFFKQVIELQFFSLYLGRGSFTSTLRGFFADGNFNIVVYLTQFLSTGVM